MWRHGHTLEANLKSSVFRFYYNGWTLCWTHDVILHMKWWCHTFKTHVNVGIWTSLFTIYIHIDRLTTPHRFIKLSFLTFLYRLSDVFIFRCFTCNVCRNKHEYISRIVRLAKITLAFDLGCGHWLGIRSTVKLCGLRVLSLHREVGGVRQYTR